ncbi:hypothetical protein MJT46_009837 [Ovis ammon polii x Ovis aries]|nr:hypothetical protein MJT46_009837 [Ovis ammon polii x Ovis aries]
MERCYPSPHTSKLDCSITTTIRVDIPATDLKFIMEELDKVYNNAIKAAKSIHDLDLRDGACPEPEVNENMGQREDVAEDES